MVFVVNSFNFDIPNPTHSEQHPHIRLNGFPTFYDFRGKYVTPVNLWMNHLVNVRKDKNINSKVRAIKRYWSFLETSQLVWDHFPQPKALKPLHRFRNDDLLASSKRGEIQYSTASMYMLHVIQFYEWAIYENLLKLGELSKPFEYEVVRVANHGMMRHLNRGFWVRSTDLRIRAPARNENQSLNPLNETELEAMASCLNNSSQEFVIHQLLQLLSGLRIIEACHFPHFLISKPNPQQSWVEVEIGPHVGVPTKYGKIRKVEIPSSLMTMMYKYLLSERRFTRSKKSAKESPSLLLNKYGKTFTANSIQQHFRYLRSCIREKHCIPFNHKTHDLRATYGTYRLSSLLEYMPPEDAIALLMGWMGHSNEKTLWTYLRYLKKEQVHQTSICILDEIISEAIVVVK